MTSSVPRLRVTKVDEFQFLTCLKRGLWGSRNARFKDWHVGDQLVLLVENAVAGLAEVSGSPFRSAEVVWDNGTFPHRIPLKFTFAATPEHRLPVLGAVRATLAAGFPAGGGWGLGLLNQWVMDASASSQLLAFISASKNDLPGMLEQLDTLLVEARERRDAKLAKQRKQPSKAKPASRPVGELARPTVQPSEALATSIASPSLLPSPSESTGPVEDSLHSATQAMLVEFGRAVGCSVWVASNDRSRVVAGKPLGAECLDKLPSMGLSAEATKAIGLIDVIWLKKNAPVAAFEVETTTSVHSGLLRMSDLVELVPALRMELYVVAQRERQQKVLRELARPTFRRIGLSDICRFVATEDLSDLLNRMKGFGGFVHPEIIETIAIALPEQTESALT